MDEFSGGEAIEVYIAGRLAEAQLIEELFNGHAVEYAVMWSPTLQVPSLGSPNTPVRPFTCPSSKRNFAAGFCDKQDSKQA